MRIMHITLASIESASAVEAAATLAMASIWAIGEDKVETLRLQLDLTRNLLVLGSGVHLSTCAVLPHLLPSCLTLWQCSPIWQP